MTTNKNNQILKFSLVLGEWLTGNIKRDNYEKIIFKGELAIALCHMHSTIYQEGHRAVHCNSLFSNMLSCS
jgi:hypothetical protein